jgi:hypothetical protein
MPARTNPLQSRADLRAERHARTFTREQLPAADPQVERLMREGYVPLQIASMLGMPLIDVRLQLARMTRDAVQTVTTTRGKR